MSPALTGIAGTETVGLCWGQLIWRALNYYEDVRHRQDVDWENAKFVGGCMAGKGLQKIHNQDMQRRQKERQERWNHKDQLIRHVVFGDPLEADKRYGGAEVVQVASTVEELADQVQRSLRGEKDWHDEMIEAHERTIRERFQSQRDHLTTLVEARDVEMGGRSVVGGTDIVGLTPAQVAERIAQQKERELAALALPAKHPELFDDKVATVIDRYGLSGAIPKTDAPTEGVIPLQPQRNAGKPWRGR
jgi:hypothetical protein